MSLTPYLVWKFNKERLMKTTLQKLLLKALSEYVEKAFTFDNLKLVRDRFLSLLSEQVKKTDTFIDDWACSMVERMLADDNLKRIFDWVKTYADDMLNPSICKVDPEHTLGALAKDFDFTEDSSSEVCAMPSLKSVIEILEIIIPILYDWFKKK